MTEKTLDLRGPDNKAVGSGSGTEDSREDFVEISINHRPVFVYIDPLNRVEKPRFIDEKQVKLMKMANSG